MSKRSTDRVNTSIQLQLNCDKCSSHCSERLTRSVLVNQLAADKSPHVGEIHPLSVGSLAPGGANAVRNIGSVALFFHVTTFHLLHDEPSQFTYKRADCSRPGGSLDYGGERASLCFGTSAESLGRGKGKHSKRTPTHRRLRRPGV